MEILGSEENRNLATIRRCVTVPLRGGKADFCSFYGLLDEKEHVALGLGDWKDQETPLVRVHSECLTGDVFSSEKCDCGEQLSEAVELMQDEGGILLYLRQEGRGIGLYNKLDAYHLQAKGHDTFEANRLLGLPDDARDYTVAAQMLRAMGKTSIRLLSNNPEKHRQLAALGITVVSMLNTGVFLKESNRFYLAAKASVGHSLRLN